jgi:Glutaminase
MKTQRHTLFFILMFFIAICSAKTIHESSIDWHDEKHKAHLLSKVPQQDTQIMHGLFEAYLHPEKFGLPIQQQLLRYNIQFMNAFFGPIQNPFNKYQRPAKAFVFIEQDGLTHYYLAPLIQNKSDGHYYIFDKNYDEPIMLTEWVVQLKKKYKQAAKVRFNICLHYANLPTDICEKKSYQNEVKDFQKKFSTNSYQFMPSAKREFNKSWKNYTSIATQTSSEDYPTILKTSISWHEQRARYHLLDSVVSWPSETIIQNNFEKIRDIRYFEDPDQKNFLRRISWLYPDDGCWTRTSAAIRDLFGPLNNHFKNFPRPSKVFVFGDLCANTPHSPTGNVFWWYHTAPIVRSAETNQTYVLDPAVNPKMPLPIEKWMEEIASQQGMCAGSDSYIDSFNICNGYGSQPFDTCENAYALETRSMLTQLSYLSGERERQVELDRNADDILGSNPPW